jgi:hypothetical protein
MTTFERQVLEDMSTLKAQMHQLLGVGQPGRLHQLERRVEQHERGMQRLRGYTGALGGALTLIHMAIAYVGGKHT